MAVEQRIPRGEFTAPERSGSLTGGGTGGNELLSSATGAVLIVLLAALGVTIVRVHQLLSVHMFLGMLLIGPVALKLASTGYRFVRYYAGTPSYRLKGPPPAALRAIGPIVVLSTIVVFASGVALLLAGPQSRGALLPIHKVSFIVWVAFTALHVLAHLPQLPAALRSDYGSRRARAWSGEVNGHAGRVIALASALTGGLVLALLAIPEFGSWLHAANLFHHH